MKPFLHEDRVVFEELITLVAETKRIPEDAVMRDYYITMLLDNLSKSPYKEVCVFKGGTSLSKCYPGTINRFSEDIDLTYIDTDDKSEKRISKDIKKIEKVMVEGFEFEPISSERSNLSKSMDVWHVLEDRFSSVKLEIGGRIHPIPTVEKTIKSYIHEYLLEEKLEYILNDYYFSDKIELSVLDITRTFIDKVHAVKTQSLIRNITSKVRHIYDVVRLYEHEEIKRFLSDEEELKKVNKYAKKASEFYVSKRDFAMTDELEGKYNLADWRHHMEEPSVRSAYERLHDDLLYTDEKQDFDLALKVFEKIDKILNEL